MCWGFVCYGVMVRVGVYVCVLIVCVVLCVCGWALCYCVCRGWCCVCVTSGIVCVTSSIVCVRVCVCYIGYMCVGGVRHIGVFVCCLCVVVMCALLLFVRVV